MTFRRFKQNKLWRDTMVERAEEAGSKIHWTRLDDAAFAQELKAKFMEEAQEVASATTNEQLIEELADVLEVITSLCDVHNFTMEDIIAAQQKKNEKRGGFQGRKFVTLLESPRGSFLESYCLADPEKYPEIID